MAREEYLTAERNGRGATYANTDGKWTLYKHGDWPRNSVNHGQSCRTYIRGGFTTLEDAQKYAYDHHAGMPVKVLGDATSYAPPSYPSQPPSWFDANYAGERW